MHEYFIGVHGKYEDQNEKNKFYLKLAILARFQNKN